MAASSEMIIHLESKKRTGSGNSYLIEALKLVPPGTQCPRFKTFISSRFDPLALIPALQGPAGFLGQKVGMDNLGPEIHTIGFSKYRP